MLCQNGTPCCLGYKWNDILEKCTPCKKGYSGPKCDTICVYPSYGLDCQSSCNCIANQCDHANGCKQHTKDISHESTTNVLEQTTHFELSTKEPFHVKANTVKAASTPTTHIIYHKSAMSKIEPMTIGTIILAVVCFILVILILYTYQMENSNVCIK
uniref:EGF-like domain-containing protein n=1 Tax=Magallana gigas TaxID=29159 RepID=A0A8W8MCU1_MAGGI